MARSQFAIAAGLALALTATVGSGPTAAAGHSSSRSTSAKPHGHMSQPRLVENLRHALHGSAHLVGLAKARHGDASGLIVSYLVGHSEHRMFMDAITGKTTPLAARPAPRRAPPSMSVNSFLTALQAALSDVAGSPISAVVQNGGTAVAFTVNVGGQSLHITVSSTSSSDVSSSSGSVGASASGTTSSASPSAPTVSFAAAASTALDALSSAQGAYIVGASLETNGDQGQAAIWRFDVVTTAGVAQVSVDAQAGTLVGLELSDDRGDLGDYSGAPSVDAVTAAGAASASDASGVMVEMKLDSQDGGQEFWDVQLANSDGSTTSLQVDATSGAVTTVGVSSSQDGQDQGGNAQFLANLPVSLAAALPTALASLPSGSYAVQAHVSEGGGESHPGPSPVWHLNFVTPTGEAHAAVDATTGALLRLQVGSETATASTAPAAPAVSIDAAAAAVLAQTGTGQVVGVELSDGGQSWIVDVLNTDGSRAQFSVDASTGAVTSAQSNTEGPGQGADS